jgi:hypothetical protein
MKGDQPNRAAGVKRLPDASHPRRQARDAGHTREDPPQSSDPWDPDPVGGLGVGGEDVAPRRPQRCGAASPGAAGAGGSGRQSAWR